MADPAPSLTQDKDEVLVMEARLGSDDRIHGLDPGARTRREGTGLAVTTARKSFSKPLKKLKMGPDIKARWELPEVGPNVASPQSQRPGSCDRPEKSLQTLEKAQSGPGHDKAR